MKKVSKTIIICMLITITLSTLFLLNKREDKKIYQEEQQSKENKFLTLMIEKEVISGKYEESSGTFFEDGYSFNESLSKCENGSKIKYNEKDKTVDVYTTKGDKCYVYLDNIQVKGEFDYTGNYEEYIVPTTGTYKIELWGAQGGYRSVAIGGKGAYVKGNISLEKGEILYVYVGENNNTTNGMCNANNVEVFNGTIEPACALGGGATDVRLQNGMWHNFDSLKTRIMVAAGGGSAYYSGTGGYGGALNGGDGEGTSGESSSYVGKGATQTTFSFGVAKLWTSNPGNGYYAGQRGWGGNAGGGSSFISGYKGCVAIKEESTEDNVQPKDNCTDGTNNIECSYHYSGKIFTETQMIPGNEEMPSPSGGTEVGHTGNGYAKITLIK